MRLPNYSQAVIHQRKLVDYLLCLTHPKGQDKATFFYRFGFSVEHPEILAAALLDHASRYEVAEIHTKDLGFNYVIRGRLRSPDGRNPWVKTVWFIPFDEVIPTLTTAYPDKEPV